MMKIHVDLYGTGIVVAGGTLNRPVMVSVAPSGTTSGDLMIIIPAHAVLCLCIGLTRAAAK